jgi:vanillate/3-O-methylgallate O-demethylase
MKDNYEKTPFKVPFPDLKFQHSPNIPFYPEDIYYRIGLGQFNWFVPHEYTGWRDEQLSWKKTAYIHGTLPSIFYRFSGPDVTKFLSKYTVNSFAKAAIGGAKHFITVNEKGLITSDGVLLRVAEDAYEATCAHSYLAALQSNPEKFNVVASEDLTPSIFLFQVGGPRSLEILEAATGEDLHDIKFMHFRNTSINGKKFRILRFGMAATLAYELHGNVKDGPEIYDAIYQTGKAFGIRRLGLHTYLMQHTENGFLQFNYHYDLDISYFLNAKVLGSGKDYSGLRNPYELNWGRKVKFDHDFVGREALEKIATNPLRATVTLEWNAEDIADIYRSQFEGTETEPYQEFKFVNDFNDWDNEGKNVHFQDKVTDAKGKYIGLSSGRQHSYYYKRMISLGCLDLAYTKEGTEVIVVWGNPGTRQKNIRAKVARFPYYNENRNQTFDVNTVPRLKK